MSNLQITVVGNCRSPLTRRTHRVALALSTSGTTFIIRSLREEEGLLLRELLLIKAAEDHQRWSCPAE